MAGGDVEVDIISPNAKRCQIFDGVDDRVYVQNAPELRFNGNKADFSISVWIKPKVGAAAFVADNRDANDDGFRILLQANGKIAASLNTNDTNDSTTVLDGQSWYHIVVTWSRIGSMTTYINKVWQTGKALLGEAIDISSDLHFGKSSYDVSGPFLGGIAQARIYNRVLSTDDIDRLYVNDVPKLGLVGEWLFEGDFKDTSGRGYDGTNSGSRNGIVDDTIATIIEDEYTNGDDVHFITEMSHDLQVVYVNIQGAK